MVLDAAGIDHVVTRMAAELSRYLDDDTVVVGTLKGGLIVTSDLVRRLAFHPVVDFVAVSAFAPGARAATIKRPDLALTDRRVVLVTDVIDTGLSLQYVLDDLGRDAPRSITVCTLVDKPHRRLVPVPVDHVGISVDHDFLIGYGLDFAGRYRNLPVLLAGDPDLLASDPGCYLEWAHRNRVATSEPRSPSG